MLGAEHPERYLPYPRACTSGRHSPSLRQRPPADMAHQRRPRPSPTTILTASVSRPPHPPHKKASGRPRTTGRCARPARRARRIARSGRRARDPLPGLYACVSHAPSVAPGARHFTVNQPKGERCCASREPVPQVHEPCARGRAFRLRRSGTPAGARAPRADRNPGSGQGRPRKGHVRRADLKGGKKRGPGPQARPPRGDPTPAGPWLA